MIGIGKSAFMNCYNLKIFDEQVFGESGIIKIKIPLSINIISRGLFFSCRCLTEIEMHDDIFEIHDGAFAGCSSLESISLPQNLRFLGCNFISTTNIKEISLPSNLKVINTAAFAESRLTKIIIPNHIIEIHPKAFGYCRNIVSMILPQNLRYIGDEALAWSSIEEITIPSGITKIPNGLFWHCINLKEIIFHENLTEIGDYAFAECTELTSINLPHKVKCIGSYAFSLSAVAEILESNIEGIETIGNYSFQNSDIINFVCPKNLKVIQSYAFSSCEKLESFKPNDNLREIQDNVFDSCENLESFELPDSLTKLSKFAFTKCTKFNSFTLPKGINVLSEGLFLGCTNLNDIVFHDDISFIEASVFCQCPLLTSINLPNNIKYIGEDSFKGMNLVSITLPSSLEEIGNYALSNLDISSISIPSSVRKIGDGAFFNCLNLDSVYILSNNITLGKNVFTGCNLLDNIEYNSDDLITEKSFSGWSKLIKLEGKTIHYYKGDDKENIYTKNLKVESIIYRNMFYECNNLISASIPESVELIEDNAFYHCQNLLAVTLPESLSYIGHYSFYECTNLATINIPENLNYVGNYAFFMCRQVNELVFRSSNISIGDCACGYINATKISYPNVGNKLPSGAYSCTIGLSEIDLSNYVSIGSYSFKRCFNLRKVILSQYLTEIPPYCFAECPNLYSINLDNIIHYGDYSFYKDYSLQLSINPNVEYIGNYSFYGNPGIESLDFSSHSCEIGAASFYGWFKLRSIIFPNNMKYLSDKVLRNSHVQKITFPDTIEIIGAEALSNISINANLKLPNNTRILKKNAFIFCWIDNIDINNKLKLIEHHCFYNARIQRIRIPSGCHVEEGAFQSCDNLREVYLEPDCVIDSNAFVDCFIEKIIICQNSHIEFPLYRFPNTHYFSIKFIFCGLNDITDEDTCKNIYYLHNSIITSPYYKPSSVCSVKVSSKKSTLCNLSVPDPTVLHENCIINHYITFTFNMIVQLN